MQKCKQCEWEFPDDISVCPYCGHPVETENKKQKRRFKLRLHPNTLTAGVKQPPSGLAPSPTPPKKHFRLVILVSTITVMLLLAGTLIGFVWAHTHLRPASQPSPTAPIDQPLIVNPSLLDYGQVEVDRKSVLSVIIKKSSESRLNWQIVPANTQWLQIALRSKASQSSNLREDIYDVTANTNKLNVGKYSALLLISSESGSKQQVNVKMQVISNSTPSTAKLNVNPLLLNFGPQNMGIQKTQLLMVINSGGQELRWSVDKGIAPWLTLDRYSGKIAAGAIPQSINVKVDTATLTAGHYSTTINLSSNGGNAPVGVQLIVTPAQSGITVTPSPTPSPTPTPTKPVLRQVKAVETGSQSVNATGIVQQPATIATGQLNFTNTSLQCFFIPAGAQFQGKSGVFIQTTQNVSLVAGGIFIVPISATAQAVNPGSNGNIPKEDINLPLGNLYISDCPTQPSTPSITGALSHSDITTYPLSQSHGYALVENTAAFTGGNDAQSYKYVQQSDIDNEAGLLKDATILRATTDLQSLVRSNEHLIDDPRCTSDIASDHNAGDKVNQVTVTVTTTCKESAST